MPQADATPHFGEREVAPPMRRQMASPMRADGRPFYLMRWQTAARDASQIVCLLQSISLWRMLCMLAGHIAHGGNIFK